MELLNIQDNIIQIATGKSHAIALSHKGTMFGWGSNKYGQLAMDPRIEADLKTPTVIGSSEKVKMQQIFAGKYCSIALGKNDTLYFWGAVFL